MTERLRISSGGPFEERVGYSRAIRVGKHIAVSGSTAVRPDGSIPEGAEAQTRQTLDTIEAALSEAGATIADVVRVRVFVSERDFVWPVSAQLKEIFDKIRPTNTTLVTQFADPAMKVEIEVTALRQRD